MSDSRQPDSRHNRQRTHSRLRLWAGGGRFQRLQEAHTWPEAGSGSPAGAPRPSEALNGETPRGQGGGGGVIRTEWGPEEREVHSLFRGGLASRGPESAWGRDGGRQLVCPVSFHQEASADRGEGVKAGTGRGRRRWKENRLRAGNKRDPWTPGRAVIRSLG